MELITSHEQSLSTARSDYRSRTFTRCRDEGLTDTEVYQLQAMHGKHSFPLEPATEAWKRFLFCFIRNPTCVLLFTAATVSAVVGHYADMAIMLGIQIINSYAAFREIVKIDRRHHSRRLPSKSTCKRENQWLDIDASNLVPGDLILLVPGIKVPADCTVNYGQIEVDASHVSGLSIPVKLHEGTFCTMGSIVISGEVQATVHSIGSHSSYGRALLMNRKQTGHSLRVHLFWILIISVSLAFILCGIALGELLATCQVLEDARTSNQNMVGYTAQSHDSIVRSSLSFIAAMMVASLPVGLEAAVALVLGVGAQNLASDGAIVRDIFSIDEMAAVDVLCSDKTGTMTTNKMEFQQEYPIEQQSSLSNHGKDDILLMAALASNWTEGPSNAIDHMILDPEVQDTSRCDSYAQHNFMPFSSALKYSEACIEALFGDERGHRFRVRKGAPEVLLQFAKNRVELEPAYHRLLREYSSRGIRCLAVARHDNAWRNEDWIDEGNWRILGILTYTDPLRIDTKQTIIEARKYGIEFKMLTGDNLLIATEVARRAQLGMDPMNPKIFPSKDSKENYIIPPFSHNGFDNLSSKYGVVGANLCDVIIPADGFAQLVPEQKAMVVAALQQSHYSCAMIGDGINDVPAIMKANVGLAVSQASEEVQAFAQILLSQPGISNIVSVILKSREIFSRLRVIIVFRIAATMQLLVFCFIGLLSMRPADYYSSNFCPNNIARENCWSSAAPFMSSRMTAFGETVFAASTRTQSSDSAVDKAQKVSDYVFYLPTPRTCARSPASSRCDLMDPASDSYSECILRNLDGSSCLYRPRLAINVQGIFIAKGYTIVNKTDVSPFEGCTLTRGCTLNPIYVMEDRSTPRRFRYPSQFLGSTTKETNDCLKDSTGGCVEATLPWPDIFVLPPLMLTIVTLLIDAMLIAMGSSFDKATGSPVPQKWNFFEIYLVSTVMGSVSCGSSLLMLWAGLDSNNPDGLFGGLGIPPMEYGKIVAMIFLKICVSELLTEDFFWTAKLGKIPGTAVFLAMAIATVLAIFWPSSSVDGVPVMGLILPGPRAHPSYRWMPLWTWLYCLLCFFIQDALKVVAYKLVRQLRFLQANQSSSVGGRQQVHSDLEKDLKLQLTKEQNRWNSWPRRSYLGTPTATWRLTI